MTCCSGGAGAGAGAGGGGRNGDRRGKRGRKKKSDAEPSAVEVKLRKQTNIPFKDLEKRNTLGTGTFGRVRACFCFLGCSGVKACQVLPVTPANPSRLYY